jgi:hypothetical protein
MGPIVWPFGFTIPRGSWIPYLVWTLSKVDFWRNFCCPTLFWIYFLQPPTFILIKAWFSPLIHVCKNVSISVCTSAREALLVQRKIERLFLWNVGRRRFRDIKGVQRHTFVLLGFEGAKIRERKWRMRLIVREKTRDKPPYVSSKRRVYIFVFCILFKE